MPIPKYVLLAVGSAAPALLLGIAMASHNSTGKPADLALNKTSITQPAKSSITVTSESTTPATLGISTTTTHVTHTSTNSPTPPAPSINQTPPITQPNDTPPITADSATVTGWTDPQPTDSKFGLGCLDLSKCPNGYTPFPTVVRYRYCIWGYTDGSSKQAIYEDEYSTVSGLTKILGEPLINCTIANAPTPH